jgi:hypothetical protein
LMLGVKTDFLLLLAVGLLIMEYFCDICKWALLYAPETHPLKRLESRPKKRRVKSKQNHKIWSDLSLKFRTTLGTTFAKRFRQISLFFATSTVARSAVFRKTACSQAFSGDTKAVSCQAMGSIDPRDPQQS